MRLKLLQEPPALTVSGPATGGYIINHLTQSFRNAISPPSKRWLFFSIVIKAITAVGRGGGGGGRTKPQKLKIDQGSCGGRRRPTPRFTPLTSISIYSGVTGGGACPPVTLLMSKQRSLDRANKGSQIEIATWLFLD